MEHFLQPYLEGLILAALVELADEMAAGAQGVAGELECR